MATSKKRVQAPTLPKIITESTRPDGAAQVLRSSQPNHDTAKLDNYAVAMLSRQQELSRAYKPDTTTKRVIRPATKPVIENKPSSPDIQCKPHPHFCIIIIS